MTIFVDVCVVCMCVCMTLLEHSDSFLDTHNTCGIMR